MSASATERRQRAERRGRWAERAAAMLLRLKGFRILGRNVRTPAGELDIVARRGRLVVFCEVKARADADTAAAALGPRQQARIERAALAYLQRRRATADTEVRFDVVLVPRRGIPRHVVDAWRPKT